MQDLRNAFVSPQFLRSIWALDYEAFKGGDDERHLLERLRRWAARTDLKETSAEAAFLEEFFRETWGYVQSGQSGADHAFTLYPKFSVSGAGARGGPGEADAALGWFSSASGNLVPQVLCEFKDIKSALDAPQKRKGNNRSPVKQGLDYLGAARRGLFGDEPILPSWAIITDMNEFRLYWADRGHQQYLQFTIRPTHLFQGRSLLSEGEESRFDRYLFFRLFHRDTLLVRGVSGRPLLTQLIAQQWVRERELENEFYREYRNYREYLYRALLEHNGEGTDRFPGTRGRLVRFAQKILDRCLFVFFCEDMGRALGFPPQLLRDFLIAKSNDRYFEPEGGSIWEQMRSLFRAMNDGSAFGAHKLNQFNGGLFATDPALDRLFVPNRVFCQPGQGQNEASLYSHPRTLLYLSASYNYASGWAQGLTRPPLADEKGGPGDAAKRDPSRSLGLYTLGRIFEQSITELEILEAEAEGRPSVNKESKRKRDGVYYTPEWVVERIVEETLGRRMAEMKLECGWPKPGSSSLPGTKEIDAYETALKALKIVDPACGSGAFLITALRYLVDDWRAVQELRRKVAQKADGKFTVREGAEESVIRDILRDNLYGVDINPASVEITKLALWLHTARGDKPLSSLDGNIRDGNSLIDSSFYKGLLPPSPDEQERINAFDWEETFPEVFARGGFDAVVGNPPYVKLQNFRKGHADVAEFLKMDRGGNITYESTQTGNFDLYLPFIEKGVRLLNDKGRLGYIAPSLWTMNEYGAGLRDFVMRGRHLSGWIDFRSFQVFDEATTYTALQFYSKAPNDKVYVSVASDGIIPDDPWADEDAALSYEQLTFGDRWLLTTGADRRLINKLYAASIRLDHPAITRQIYQGLITSADSIFHLTRIGQDKYLCSPKGGDAPPPYEVAIEDALMKPLVSGSEAKRYIEPITDTYLLFPYTVDEDGARLISAEQMATVFPSAWIYLKSWEGELRAREKNTFDDDNWHRFGRNQNLDKQEIEKLIVPRLVTHVSCSVDHAGSSYLDNVDVGGVVMASNVSPFFVAGVLNAPVSAYVFRRISKPFRGEFRSANKQFIAPLPIPKTAKADQAQVAARAERLQSLHTSRRDLLADLRRRLQTVRFRCRPYSWLFPDFRSRRDLGEQAPARLDAANRKAWIDARLEQDLDERLTALGKRVTPGAALDAEFENGELRFLINGRAEIDRIFLGSDEGAFILAQWKLLASTTVITEKTDGRKFANLLRKIGASDNPALVSQVVDLQTTLSAIDADIAEAEADMNRLVYRLYGLTDAEAAHIERG